MNKLKRLHYFILIWINLFFRLFAQVYGKCDLDKDYLWTCIFDGDDETRIRTTISTLQSQLKSLSINSNNVSDLGNIFKDVNLTKLEMLTVGNAKTQNVDMSQFYMPMLTSLHLTNNAIKSFIFPNNHHLRFVNLSNNNLEQWGSQNGFFKDLELLDLSNNNFRDFTMENHFINNFQLSNSFSVNNLSVRIVMTANTSELIDLSKNNLNDISFIRLLGPVKMLKLQTNKITNLSGFSSSLTPNIIIDLSENPLQCSTNLNDNLIVLKLQGITFSNDLECSFVHSVNKYSVAKYGWMFDSETKILDTIYNATLLQAYMNARNVKIWSEISTNRFRIGWKIERILMDNYFLALSLYSPERQIYSKTIDMKKSDNVDIVLKDKTLFANACVLANIAKLLSFGIENTTVSINCQNISNYSLLKEGNSEIGYIVTIPILIILLGGVTICFVIYFYKTKKSISFRRGSKQSSKDINYNDRKRIPVINEANVSQPVFHNDAYDPEIDNQLRRNTTRILNESRISSNIYEIMETSNDNSFPTKNDKKIREDITSNIYETMENSNNENSSQNLDTYLRME